MKLVFATANENKAFEIRSMLPAGIELLTLKDLEFNEDIPETSDTLQGNAILKADYITERTGFNCFADDTGLETYSIDMEPGVKSARYAGEHRNDDDNIDLLLDKLSDKQDRKARFCTVIALNLDKEQHLFEGIVEGTIRNNKIGLNGFGYDPIFEPENCGRTFAEMTVEEKNQFSHRARAFQKMILFLKNQIDLA